MTHYQQHPEPDLPNPGQEEYRGHQAQWPPQQHEVKAAPTAWQSLPMPIRVAVWIWAVGTILSVTLGVLIFSLIYYGMSG